MSELNNFFKQLSDLKAADPVAQKKKKFETTVKENLKEDFGSLFAELAALKTRKEEIIQENPQLVEEVLIETKPISTPIGEIPTAQQNPAIADLPSIDKYLKSPQFEVPDVSDSQREIQQINNKMKFLEQWIGKINNAGPGSGEVNLRYLDDVDRNTIADNRYLRYNASTKKFMFDDVDAVGDYLTAIDTTNQTFASSVPTVITINTQTTSRNISVVDGSKITFTKTGTYNIQYSVQAVNPDNAQWDMSIWINKNGAPIPDSNSVFTIPIRKTPSIYGKLILTSPIPVDVTAGDYVQLMGHTESSLVSLSTLAADAVNGIPRTPSVIVVVSKL